MGLSTRDEFAVDENGLTFDGYRRLAPVSKKAMYIANVIAIVIVAAIFSTPFIWPDVLGMWASPVQIVSVVIIVATAVYCLAAPEITYRRYRYRIDDEKAELRKGIVFITHTMVPIERIHQVDVSRGPINRAFGLEVHHLYDGGQLARCDYAVKRLRAFLDRGERVEELEGGVLPIHYRPALTPERSCMVDYRLLISYCIQ